VCMTIFCCCLATWVVYCFWTGQAVEYAAQISDLKDALAVSVERHTMVMHIKAYETAKNAVMLQIIGWHERAIANTTDCVGEVEIKRRLDAAADARCSAYAVKTNAAYTYQPHATLAWYGCNEASQQEIGSLETTHEHYNCVKVY